MDLGTAEVVDTALGLRDGECREPRGDVADVDRLKAERRHGQNRQAGQAREERALVLSFLGLSEANA